MTLVVPTSSADPGGDARQPRAARPALVETPDYGAQIARFGEIAARVGTQIEADRRKREMDRARVDVTASLNDLRLEVEGIADPDEADAAWVSGAQAIFAGFTKPGENGRPRVSAGNAEEFQLYFDDLSNRHALALGRRSLIGRRAVRGKVLARHTDEVLRTAGIADPGTTASVLADLHEHIEGLVADGMMSEEEASGRKAEATARVVAAQSEGTGRRLRAIAARAFDPDVDVDAEFLSRDDVREHPEYAGAVARVGLATERPDLPQSTPADLSWLAAHDRADGLPPEVQAQRRVALAEMAVASGAALEADAMGHALAVGLPVAEVPPLDPANPAPFAGALAMRRASADWMEQEGYTREPAPLLSLRERTDLDAALRDEGARRAAGMAVAAQFGDAAPGVLAELGIDAFEFDPDAARAVASRLERDAGARIVARAMDYAPTTSDAAEEIRSYLRTLDERPTEDRPAAIAKSVSAAGAQRRAETARPLYYGGGEITPEGLKATAARIVKAHRAGRMDAETYARQARLVRDLMETFDG